MNERIATKYIIGIVIFVGVIGVLSLLIDASNDLSGQAIAKMPSKIITKLSTSTDSDGDGYSDMAEMLAGTSARDASDYPLPDLTIPIATAVNHVYLHKNKTIEINFTLKNQGYGTAPVVLSQPFDYMVIKYTDMTGATQTLNGNEVDFSFPLRSGLAAGASVTVKMLSDEPIDLDVFTDIEAGNDHVFDVELAVNFRNKVQETSYANNGLNTTVNITAANITS